MTDEHISDKGYSIAIIHLGESRTRSLKKGRNPLCWGCSVAGTRRPVSRDVKAPHAGVSDLLGGSDPAPVSEFERRRGKRPLLTMICERCGVSFSVKPYEVKRGRGRFCSHACAASIASDERDQFGQKNPNWRGGITDSLESVCFAKTSAKARYRERHRDRHLAHKAVQTAIARGYLSRRPCEVCGSAESHAHHDDYSRKLEVRWLCHSHHMELHYS